MFIPVFLSNFIIIIIIIIVTNNKDTKLILNTVRSLNILEQERSIELILKKDWLV